MCYIGYLVILISIVCMTVVVVAHGGIAHMPIALAHSLVVLVVVFFRSLILYDILWNIHFHFIWAASQ